VSGLLLDTNAALWLVADSEKLGPDSRDVLAEQPLWASSVSLWEVEIKRRVGKLTLSGDFADGLRRAGVRELPLSWHHTRHYASVALPRRDPFDLLLLAQAKASSLDFLTADRQILAAGLPFVHDARE